MLPLAMGVQGLCEFADASLLRVRGGGKRKLVEAVNVIVGWIISDTEPTANPKRK
jgi:hypothetical protein